MPVTIVFRGLMAFAQPQPPNGRMEIGVVRAPHHFPRILTMKRGVLAGIFDLRRRRNEFDIIREWRIEVTNPAPGGVVVRTDNVEPFNRRSGNHPEWDYRWMTDLEGSDLHNRDLTNDLDTRNLRMVITVVNGTFATRLQSPPFIREQLVPPGVEVDYGRTAAVSECVISFGAGGRVRFMANATETFAFPDEPDTIYEITNAPPDVDPGNPNPGGGHFHMYYDHFFRPNPREKFNLRLPSSAPAPDPALCGVGRLSQRRTSLV